MENIHEGHRKRVRERFLKHGLESFQPHEMLELLLFFGIPRVNTNDIAHELISHFGSLQAVFNASVSQLQEVKGVTENAAVLISLVPHFARIYTAGEMKFNSMVSVNNVVEYFASAYLGANRESVKVCCLDDRLRIVSCADAMEGTVSNSPVCVRKIAEAAFRANSSIIVIAHNHPSGSAEPSAADVSATRQIASALSLLGIETLDHVIVGKDSAISMKQSGYFNMLLD